MSEELKDSLYRPNEDTIFMSDFNEDEVVHTELIGKRRVYSETAYNKLREALEECEILIDEYIDAERPLGSHRSWDQDNAREKAQNPARLALGGKG